MTLGLLSIALICYIAGICLAVIGTLYRSDNARRAASVLFPLTWLAHLAAVVSEGLTAGRFPLANLAEYLLVLSWAVLSIHLYIWFRLRIYMAGLLLPPLAAIAALAALPMLSGGSEQAAARQDALLLFHIAVSTLGMATLCAAFAMSVLYLIQDRALKVKRTLVLLQRLPSLSRCDHIGFRALKIGFFLLTVGIGTGVVVNVDLHHKIWIWGAKGTFPLLAWIVFAATLTARTALGFHGRKSAYLIIVGFVLGLLTIIGMTL
jgi:ABC-type transport system involved in cytochrome c biogenesis permease subunit